MAYNGSGSGCPRCMHWRQYRPCLSNTNYFNHSSYSRFRVVGPSPYRPFLTHQSESTVERRSMLSGHYSLPSRLNFGTPNPTLCSSVFSNQVALPDWNSGRIEIITLIDDEDDEVIFDTEVPPPTSVTPEPDSRRKEDTLEAKQASHQVAVSESVDNNIDARTKEVMLEANPDNREVTESESVENNIDCDPESMIPTPGSSGNCLEETSQTNYNSANHTRPCEEHRSSKTSKFQLTNTLPSARLNDPYQYVQSSYFGSMKIKRPSKNSGKRTDEERDKMYPTSSKQMDIIPSKGSPKTKRIKGSL